MDRRWIAHLSLWHNYEPGDFATGAGSGNGGSRVMVGRGLLYQSAVPTVTLLLLNAHPRPKGAFCPYSITLIDIEDKRTLYYEYESCPIRQSEHER